MTMMSLMLEHPNILEEVVDGTTLVVRISANVVGSGVVVVHGFTVEGVCLVVNGDKVVVNGGRVVIVGDGCAVVLCSWVTLAVCPLVVARPPPNTLMG